jgi:hypothetical protein
MTQSSVSVQGFTHKNDTCDTLKLSHPRGAPHENGIPGVDSCKSFRILIGRQGGRVGDDGSPKSP